MRTIARILAIVVMTAVFVGALVAHEGQLFQNVASTDIGVINQGVVDVELNAGTCWTSGKENGYPTRMWVTEKDAFGAVYVEVTSQARIDRAVAGRSSARVYAFCDGIAL